MIMMYSDTRHWGTVQSRSCWQNWVYCCEAGVSTSSFPGGNSDRPTTVPSHEWPVWGLWGFTNLCSHLPPNTSDRVRYPCRLYFLHQGSGHYQCFINFWMRQKDMKTLIMTMCILCWRMRTWNIWRRVAVPPLRVQVGRNLKGVRLIYYSYISFIYYPPFSHPSSFFCILTLCSSYWQPLLFFFIRRYIMISVCRAFF